MKKIIRDSLNEIKREENVLDAIGVGRMQMLTQQVIVQMKRLQSMDENLYEFYDDWEEPGMRVAFQDIAYVDDEMMYYDTNTATLTLTAANGYWASYSFEESGLGSFDDKGKYLFDVRNAYVHGRLNELFDLIHRVCSSYTEGLEEEQEESEEDDD